MDYGELGERKSPQTSWKVILDLTLEGQQRCEVQNIGKGLHGIKRQHEVKSGRQERRTMSK